jgi:fructose transport system permease protein
MSDDASGSATAERGLQGAAAAVASFDEADAGFVRRLQGFLHDFPTMIPLIVLLIGVVIFTFAAPGKFLSPLNLSVVLQQVTIVAVLGMAQTLVVLTAGIDLSVGLIMILCHVVMGRTAVVFAPQISASILASTGISIDPVVIVVVSFPLGLICGLACGLLNGLLVTKLRLPPFIVTLGTWSIFGALNTFYSNSETIRSQDMDASAPFFLWLGKLFKLYDIGKFFGMDLGFLRGWVVTYGSVLMIILAIVLSYVLSRTAFGRHIYATGDDPDAARLSGINTDRVLLAVYGLAGLICAIAAWVLIGRIGGVSPQAGQTANLDSITAVVIGGTSLFGGRGSIVGTLFGALIVGVFRNGLALSGLALLWQDFAVGVLIIVAVTIDQWIRKISA